MCDDVRMCEKFTFHIFVFSFLSIVKEGQFHLFVAFEIFASNLSDTQPACEIIA